MLTVNSNVANQNASNGKERRDITVGLVENVVFTAVAIRRSRWRTLPPSEIQSSPARFCAQGEGERFVGTASLEVIWVTGSVDVINSLITPVLFIIDLSSSWHSRWTYNKNLLAKTQIVQTGIKRFHEVKIIDSIYYVIILKAFIYIEIIRKKRP